MNLPVRPVVRPSDLAGVSNGVPAIPPQQAVVMPCGARTYAHHLCWRAWLAMSAALRHDTGYVLCSVGFYRLLSTQISGFLRSYLDHYDPALCQTGHTRQYQGKTWYLLKNTIPKAVPGTSNHGWGTAVDAAVYVNGVHKSIRGIGEVWSWLIAHAGEFGFSWAYPTEGVDDPHLQLFTGDHPTAKVLAFEAAGGTIPGPVEPAPTGQFDPAHGLFGNYPTVAKPTVRQGSTGNAVLYLQGVLTGIGIKLGCDGKFGPQTDAGVRTFQTARHLTVDGIVGPQTWAAVDAVAKSQGVDPTTRPVLRKTTTFVSEVAEDVRLVQATVGATADGWFGPRTDMLVRAFQKARGLIVDGVVGPQTWAAILL